VIVGVAEANGVRVRVGVREGVAVPVDVIVGVREGVGDLKLRAASVCWAASVWAAWVKAAPGGTDVAVRVGWLETAGRQAPKKKTTSAMIATFAFICNLLDAGVNCKIPEQPDLSIYHLCLPLQVEVSVLTASSFRLCENLGCFSEIKYT
jgi:hypothetical protein